PVGVGVDLHRGAGAGGGAEDGVPVGVDHAAPADLAGGRVADDVDVRVLAGGDEAPGHLVAAHREVGVDRGHPHVEAAQDLAGPVDRAVGRDVEDRKSTRLNSSHVKISY